MNPTWKVDVFVPGRGLMGLMYDTEEAARGAYNEIVRAQDEHVEMVMARKRDDEPVKPTFVTVEDVMGVHRLLSSHVTTVGIYALASHEEFQIFSARYQTELEEKCKRAVQAVQGAPVGFAKPPLGGVRPPSKKFDLRGN